MIFIGRLLLGLLFALLQITLANLIALFNVKPDLVLIYVIIRALKDGPTAGVVWGLGLGFLLDAVSGGWMGLGALSFSVAGFLAGQIGLARMIGRLHYIIALAVCVPAGHAIFLHSSELEGSYLAAGGFAALYSGDYLYLVAWIALDADTVLSSRRRKETWPILTNKFACGCSGVCA